jgi:hypothetical protein
MSSIYTNYKIVVLDSNNEPKETILFSGGENGGSEMKIHPDDTIQLIKKKFLKEYRQRIAYEEIYMFSRILREVPTESFFNSITDSGAYINRNILRQVLSNLGLDSDLDLAEEKEKYSYEEFASLMDNKKSLELQYKIPLDRKFQSKQEEQFSANPFDIIIAGTADFFTDKRDNPLITLDNQVLLNHNGGKFIDDTIYVCLAEDVLDYCCNENGSDDYAILKMYFSRMITAFDINSQEQWLENREKMIAETGKMMNESTFKMAKIVDLFYEMARNQDIRATEYLERGIKSITVSIVPTVSIGLPLESIFKTIHAVEMLPFIKFNPGFRRENIYRIYCDKMTKRGEKVPFMKKNIILRLANELGRKKIISFYTYDAGSKIYVDLESNGNVKIRGTWEKSMNMEEISQQLAYMANPIISKINDLLVSSGHSISLLESLNQSGVIIGEVTYFWKTDIRRNTIHLKKLANCLSPIFEINDKDANIENEEGVELRFKRVDNYRDMDAQEIFVNEIYQKTGDVVKVKELFKEKFGVSEEEAVEKIAAYFNDEFRGAEDISDSPGFSTRMRVENFNGAIFYAEIIISKHIEYVDILNMYIEGILRITQDKTKKHLMQEIRDICLNSKLKKREPEENVPIIKNIEVVEPIKVKRNLLEEEFGILGEDDEEHDEEDEEEDENIEFEYEEEDEESGGGGGGGGGCGDIDTVKVEVDTFPNKYDFANVGYNFDGGDGSDEGADIEGTDEKYDESYLNGKEIASQIGVLRRMQEKDPVLFNYKHKGVNKGMFTSYARACQGPRQPMILTAEEKAKIDEKNPDSYESAIRYGSDANKQFWYVCPRFWCLKTNTPISEEDAKSGKCGKILPKDAKKILPGHYVYEFDRKGHTTPEFFKENERHPNGFCLPCCFKKSAENEAFKKRREECMLNDHANAAESEQAEEPVEEPAEEAEQSQQQKAIQQKKILIKTNEKYIRNIEKFPLEPQRWGFLPVSIQKMLQIKSNMSNPNIANNKKSMLRYGIELSKTKSFIACIADVYASENKRADEPPSISEMCNIIANAVSIDIFVQAHNGSLPSMFQPKQYDYADIDYTKYDESKFIQSIQFGNDAAQEDFMNDTIAAYENFLHFLRTPESIIDYTYLWDIVSIPNPLLFKRGVNLAILEIPDNDATDHVEVVCPTAAYSSAIYTTKKETLILIKRKSESNEEITYFEPVYLYDAKEITRTFSANTQIKSIQHILQVIRNFSQKKCAPLKSMPKEYSFERNKSATQIREICAKYNIDLLAQVLNFQGKIVAFLVKRKRNSKSPSRWISDIPIYLPCAPSAMMPDIEIVKYINDEDIWQNFHLTYDELSELSRITEGNLLCKPVIKVIEDGLIIGILTETNQFVMINPPEVDNYLGDGLIELKDTNYIMADIDLANGRKIDKVRERTIKMIRLEKYFYQVFRTTLRILLQESVNEKAGLLKEIENLTYENYSVQLKKVEELLHKIMDSYVEFQIYDESILMSLNEISDCFSSDSDKKQYCIFKSYVRKLLIPQRNLISGKQNNRVYFMRLADELLRYKRIRNIIFYKNAFISETDYQLNVDEIILLENMMDKYFEKDLSPAMKIKDAHISYEFANPYKSVKYSNEVKLSEQKKLVVREPLDEGKEAKKVEPLEEELKLECTKETRDVVGNTNNVWKQYFPRSAKEIVLNPSVNCTYYPILIIYKNNYEKIITIEELKQKLVRTYKELSKYEKKILHILSLQGKYDMMQKIAKKETTMEETIMSGMYPLSNLDYWVLCEVLKLPVILFSSLKIKNLLKDVSWVRLGENNDYKKPEYYFIRAPTEKESKKGVNAIYAYSIIYSIDKNRIKMGINLNELSGFQDVYESATENEELNLIDLEIYLSGNFLE